MGIISTIDAKCKDCYKCLRECPVKAIKMERGALPHELHARVCEERCIFDGRCVLVCPQNAKKVTSDLENLRPFLREGGKVAASVAPSFPSAFPDIDPQTIPTALRLIGFGFVQETAIGAELVSREYARRFRKGDARLISSPCPVVVNLIERHYPEVIPYLAPIVSPMVAHGRYIKQIMPGTKVAFIGPCIAKLGERETPGIDDSIDFVITFEELRDVFLDEGIDLGSLEPSEFDGALPDKARLFPVEGGILRSASLSTDMLDSDVLTVSGLESCKEVLKQFTEGMKRGDRTHLPRLVDMLACEGGCINGPKNPSWEDIYTRRARVLEYVKQSSDDRNRERGTDFKDVSERPEIPQELLRRNYRNLKPSVEEPDESVIRAILAKTGKHSQSDELNCGACGYDSCRDKAVAVFQGMADPEMCIPYMRERAESVANLFVASTPNAIIVIDENETIRDLNAAAEGMFKRKKDEVIGKTLSTIMEPGYFRKALQEKTIVQGEVCYLDMDLVTYQTIFYEPGERLAMGIISDITEERRRERHLLEIREQTLEKAQGVINKQMEVAQKIAGLLGETTAETKVLLTKLMNTFKNEGEDDGTSSR
ncbi:MAG: PAS domain S-box protein [Firmicutes bacterium]|nr:PAS domain S-box protein [Bacillota bacterium]HXL03656.1 [Fe-Fe] hydrogenase large subunit C-terminal domain-containing protein [Bacillota bacterium]